MMIIKKYFNDKKQLYNVSIDAYNFHFVYGGDNKKYAEFIYDSFTSINEGLKIAYRDMCNFNPKELPSGDRFLEMLDNSIKELI